MKRLLIAALMVFASVAHAAAADEMAEREARWKDVAGNIFGERPMWRSGRMLIFRKSR